MLTQQQLESLFREFRRARIEHGFSFEQIGLCAWYAIHAIEFGSLPADPKRLARIAGLDEDELDRLMPAVMTFFEPSYKDPQRLICRSICRAVRRRRRRQAQANGAESGAESDADAEIEADAVGSRALVDPLPNPLPANHPVVLAGSGGNRQVSQALLDAFWRLVDEYPNASGVNLACQYWTMYCQDGLITEHNVDGVFDGLRRWRESEQWVRDGGRYIPTLAKWLAGRMWLDRPKPCADAVAVEEWRPPWGD